MSQEIQQNQQVTTLLKRRRKWPVVLGAAAAAALGIFALSGSLSGGKMVVINPTETAKLVRTDLQDSVSATGTVESADSMTVYSTMAYTVQEVLVEVGDRVEQGQLLCRLDGQKLLDQIETQQAGLDASAAASDASITAARDNYEQFKSNLDKGLNSTIISAENAVTNAYNNYQTAQNNYDRYLAGLQTGENTTLLAQETALRSARTAVENAHDAYDKAVESYETAVDSLETLEETLRSAKSARRQAADALEDYQVQLEELEEELADLREQEEDLQRQLEQAADEEAQARLQAQLDQVRQEITDGNGRLLMLQMQGAQLESAYSAAQSAVVQAEAALTQGEQAIELADSQIETCEKAITTAEEAYDTSLKQYNAALTSADHMLADYAKTVQTAFSAYETAKTSLEAAKTAANNQLQTYQNNLNSAYANSGKNTAEITLQQLQEDLEKTRITAPMSGTVTAVYAQVGATGSGLLFVIEDTEHFVVTTSIKDYDIAVVGEGTPVTIQSDATGQDVYEGRLTSIAPTANKNAMGVTDTTGEIAFAADVAVTSPDTRLRIGLNVRLELIVAREENVLAAPYEVVYQNEQGQDCILLAKEQADGTWLLREQVVELGLETDLDIAVKSDALTAGMTVISNPEKYVQYIGQPVTIGGDR